jgi:E3 ubiquitin-protein ligase HUWE1
MYKMMVGDDLVIEDLKDLDNVFHKSCMWTMKEDVTGLGFTFSINRDYFGRIETKQLIDNGSSVVVTNENKISYLEKLGCYQMYLVVKEQIDAFLQGFHEIIPKKLVGIFTAAELELLISGLPKVDCKFYT